MVPCKTLLSVVSCCCLPSAAVSGTAESDSFDRAASVVRANVQRLSKAELAAYGGTLLEEPHRNFIRGDGLLWLQRIPKAGGTTMCSVIRDNVPAAMHGCFLEPKNRTRLRLSNKGLDIYSSMTQVETVARECKVRAIATEHGAMPPYTRMADRARWVFITIMRDPLDRLLSQIQWVAQSSGAKPVTSSSLVSQAYNLSRGNVRWVNCWVDNLATRVFANKCATERSELNDANLVHAQQTLRGFDICFVTEWALEMAPILRYALGFSSVDVRPRNVAGYNAHVFTKNGGGFGAAQVNAVERISRYSMASHAEHILHAADRKKLTVLNAFDYNLYDTCQRHARVLSQAYLYPAMRARGERERSSRSVSGLGGPTAGA